MLSIKRQTVETHNYIRINPKFSNQKIRIIEPLIVQYHAYALPPAKALFPALISTYSGMPILHAYAPVLA